MYKKPLIALLLITQAIISFSQPQCELNPQNDQILTECLNRIEADSIESYMQSLEDFGTRFYLDENRKEVTKWLSKKLISFGYQQVSIDSFYYTPYPASWQYNVVCKSSDFNESEPFVIIGGHYDAVEYCPGADDNASGTAGVLEFARVQKDHSNAIKYPIKYILFAAEESGLIGSGFDAKEARLKHNNIDLMINLDMISNSSTDSANVFLSSVNNEIVFLSTIINDFSVYSGFVSEDFSNPASDHISYRNSGYNAVFFHEKEFSPYYHQPEDLVINTNPHYAAGIVKSAVSTVFGFNHLAPVISSDYFWWENGTKLTLAWETKQPADEFEIYKKEGKSYIKVGTTSEYQITLENLENTAHHFIIVSNSQQNKYASSPVEVNYNMAPPKPEHVKAYGYESTVALKWEADNRGIVAGYNVYEFKGGELKKINESLIEDSAFFVAIDDSEFHYFQLTALNSDGIESKKSKLVSAKLGEHSYLLDSIKVLLIVDMSNFNAPDSEVLQYFDFMNQDYDAYIEVVRGREKIPEELIFQAKNIIWISAGKIREGASFKENSQTVYRYLEKGGHLFLTVYNANLFTALYNRKLPSILPESSDAYTLLKTKEVDAVENSWFSGAKAEKAGYPDLTIDINHISDNYLDYFYVNSVQMIEPVQSAEAIYSYVSPMPNDVNHGNMHGMPVGYEYMGDDYKLVFLSFPINFMRKEEIKMLVEHVLYNRFGTGAEIKEKTVSNEKSQLNVWPVPANNQLNISTDGLSGTIAVYNSLGVKVLEQVINNELHLNATLWNLGTYFLTFSNNNVISTPEGSGYSLNKNRKAGLHEWKYRLFKITEPIKKNR